MATWRIESDPRPEPPGGPKTRYVIFKDAGVTPLLQLDNRDAEDLTDALIVSLEPPGYRVENAPGLPPPRGSVQIERGRVKLTTREQTFSLPRHDALGLLAALVDCLARQPEMNTSPPFGSVSAVRRP